MDPLVKGEEKTGLLLIPSREKAELKKPLFVAHIDNLEPCSIYSVISQYITEQLSPVKKRFSILQNQQHPFIW